MLREVSIAGPIGAALGARELRFDVATPGEALRALVWQVPGARAAIGGTAWEVLLDGRALAELEVYAAHGPWHRLELVPVLEGAGDGARGPLKIIAGIFLLGAALILGPAIPGALGLLNIGGKAAALIGGLGATIALQGVSQLLAPLPRMDYNAPEEADRRQSALFTGSSNLLGSGHPIPVVYGRMRSGSVQVSRTIEVVDDFGSIPEFVSIARMRVVDVVSEGEIVGLVNGDASSVLFDDTRVIELEGTVNFPNVLLDVVVGAPGDPATVSNVETVVPVATEATNADGTVGGGQTGSVARTIDDPNVDSARVTAYVQTLYLISGGNPVSDSVGYRYEVSSNGGAFQIAHISGQVLDFDPLFQTPNSSTPTNVTGIGFDLGLEWISDPGPTSVLMEWRVTGSGSGGWVGQLVEATPVYDGGSGLYQAFFAYFAANLVSNQYDVRYTPTDVEDGTLSPEVAFWGPHVLLNGTVTSSRYERDHKIVELTARYGPAPWTIRLVKLTIDKTNPAVSLNPLGFARYAEVIEREFEYNDVARITIEFDAESTGGVVPQRSYELDGMLLELPSNLNPATRTYSGVWDGTFAASRAWYDNPAWCLWDLLRSARYGLGLAEDEIDKWSVYAAAVACDVMVEDGRGGTEPRFRFSHAFTTREDSFRVISELAAAMQARLWWGSGKLFVSQDVPTPVARVFTNGNVIGGAFRYTGTARSARTSVATVTWRDPARGYDAVPALVDWPPSIDRYGRNEIELAALGCTSSGQARRRGRWEVLTNETETQTVNHRVGYLDAQLEPGEIFETVDVKRSIVREGGRVLAVIDNYLIFLDAPLPAGYSTSGKFVRVVLDDGTLHTSAFNTIGSPPDTLDLSVGTLLPLGRTVLVGAVWIISTTDANHFWRCLGVTQTAPNEFEVLGFEHNPDKQDRVEDFTDLGAPILPPSMPSVGAPTIGTLALEYDAAADLWTLVIPWTNADADAYYARAEIILGNPPPPPPYDPAIMRYGTSPSSPLRIAIGDHATWQSYDVNVWLWSVTRDGAVMSGSDSDSIAIPSSPP